MWSERQKILDILYYLNKYEISPLWQMWWELVAPPTFIQTHKCWCLVLDMCYWIRKRNKNRLTIYSFLLQWQCRKLGQFAMPETNENWLGVVNICFYYAHETREIYQALSYSVEFKAPGEPRNLLSKTVLSRCSSISKALVNIWNDRKAQK